MEGKVPRALHEFSPEDQFILSLPFDFKYYCQLRKTLENEECGFCHLDPAINKVLYQNDDWILFENAFANVRPCAVMLVVISRSHWRQLSEITPEAWASFSEMIAWAEQKYALPGGMLFLRFGDMRLNAGTMKHLHWNLWVPNGEGALLVPVHKSPKELEADRVRAAEFDARYIAGERE